MNEKRAFRKRKSRRVLGHSLPSAYWTPGQSSTRPMVNENLCCFKSADEAPTRCAVFAREGSSFSDDDRYACYEILKKGETWN